MRKLFRREKPCGRTLSQTASLRPTYVERGDRYRTYRRHITYDIRFSFDRYNRTPFSVSLLLCGEM